MTSGQREEDTTHFRNVFFSQVNTNDQPFRTFSTSVHLCHQQSPFQHELCGQMVE